MMINVAQTKKWNTIISNLCVYVCVLSVWAGMSVCMRWIKAH